MDSKQGPSKDPRKQSQYKGYLKYSGLAFQLLVGVGLAGWAGYALDRHFGMHFPLFTILLTFTCFGAMMYRIYRSLGEE